MAELVFFSGTMDCGKSTLALQLDHNHSARGRSGLIFSRNDRAGTDRLSSRLGLEVAAHEVRDHTDFWSFVVDARMRGSTVDYVICDEAQFYSTAQVEQLARLVDEVEIDVFAFGITADFRTRLFPGSARLIELADRVEVLQVQSLCWCGRARRTTRARSTAGWSSRGPGGGGQHGESASEVAYEVLCRRHHMRRMTSASARVRSASEDALTFDLPGSGA
ncbi:thymidine kinase [Oerskovia sp. M15]